MAFAGGVGIAERIQEAAKDASGLRFDELMAMALYDPEGGYFSKSSQRAGRQGDFMTAPSTSPMFGQCIANWIRRLPGPIENLVEIGAGDGTLAQNMRESLDRPVLAHHLVEIGATNRAALAKRFAHDARPPLLYAQVADLPAAIGAGVLVANELFDNIPVRRVMQTDGLNEIRVRWLRGRFEEILVPAPAELHDYFRSQGVQLRAGQTAEVCLEAPRLLKDAVARLQRPRHVLLFDYGAVASHLYAVEAFPQGSLECHRRHGKDRNYYQDLGDKDLTAHVNFTALAQVLEDEGFEVEPLQRQARFLLEHGLGELMKANLEGTGDPVERAQAHLRARQLLHPEAMGDDFQVLVAHDA
jgi:SAM-dependent MidA family methyltransferase